MCSIVHYDTEVTMLLSAIGTRLKQQRTELGLTQAGLAREAGVSPRFLVQLEKGEGNISVQRLHAVCAVLGLSLERLFQGLGPDDRAKIALVGLRGAGKSTIGGQIMYLTGMVDKRTLEKYEREA